MKEKVGLLYQLSEEDMNDSKVRYIFEKGRTDTHYWVRMAATRFDSKGGAWSMAVKNMAASEMKEAEHEYEAFKQAN